MVYMYAVVFGGILSVFVVVAFSWRAVIMVVDSIRIVRSSLSSSFPCGGYATTNDVRLDSSHRPFCAAAAAFFIKSTFVTGYLSWEFPRLSARRGVLCIRN
uniref:Uncharacterized protein n=1 Tax=Lotharella oceanica TaxID=641309 RepID=A0A7S2U491_9EUKA